jgi:tape measure domain-containing protein
MAKKLKVLIDVDMNDADAVAELEKLQRKLKGVDPAAKTGARGMRDFGGATDAAVTALKGLIPVLSVGAITGFAAQVSRAAESQRKFAMGFEAITGNANAAAREMSYIAETSQRLGLRLEDASSAYLSLSAAARGTSLEGQASREIFESVATAMQRLGRTSAETEGALTAIEQMISKGKVSAEELRGQLGERLPGAFQAAARAIGVTTAELDGMLQAGQLTAEELLPKLAAELRSVYDDGTRIGTLEAEWNRFTNALDLSAVAADEASGLNEKLAAAIRAGTEAAEALRTSLESGVVGEELQRWGRAADGIGALASVIGTLADEIRDFADGLTDAVPYFDRLIKIAERGLNPVRGMLDAFGMVGDAISGYSTGGTMDDYVTTLDTIVVTADKVDGAINDVAASVETLAKNWGMVESPGVNKTLRDRLELMIEEEGLTGRVTSALRSYNEQYKLYQKYLAGGPLAAKPGTSLHEQGKAIDYVVEGQKKITKEMAEQYGLKILLYDNSPHVHLQLLDDEAKARKSVTRELRAQRVEMSAHDRLLQDAGRSVDALIKRYLPAEQAARDLAEAQAALAIAGERAGLSQEQQALILERLEGGWKKAADEADKAATAMEKVMTGAFEEIGRSIQRELGDAIYDMLDGSLDDAEDWADAFKDIVKRTVSEIAAAVVQQRIVLPIVASVMPGAASAMGFAGQAGGLFGGGGLTGDPNTSIFDNIPGIGGLLGGASTGLASVGGGALGYIGGALGVGSSQAAMLGAQGGLAGIGATNAALGGAGGLLGGLGAVASAALPIVGAIGAIGSMTGLFGGLFGDDKKHPGAIVSLRDGRIRAHDAQDMTPEMYQQFSTAIDQYNAAVKELAKSSPEAARALKDWDESARALSAASLEKQLIRWGEKLNELAAESTEEAARNAAEAYAESIKKAVAELRSEADGVSGALGAILTEALEATADDPQLLQQAIALANEAYAQLTAVAQGMRHTFADIFLDLTGTVDEQADHLYRFVDAMRASGESLGDALARVQTGFAAMEIALDATQGSLPAFGGATGQWANQTGQDVAGWAGGIDALRAGADTFFREFLDQAEQADRLAARAAEQITRLMGSTAWQNWAPDRDAFRAVIDGIDLTTEHGEYLAGMLLRLAPQFDAWYDNLERVGDAVDDLNDGIAQTADVIARFTQDELASVRAFLADANPNAGRDAWDQLQAIFAKLRIAVPQSAAALRELYLAGQISLPVMVDLVNATGLLSSAFGHLEEQQRAAERAAEEAQRAAEEAAREAERRAEEAARARIAAERDRIGDLYDARRDGLDQELEATREWAAQLGAIIGDLDRGFDAFRPQVAEIIELEFERARRQLSSLADSGAIPDAEAFAALIDRLTGSQSSRTGRAQDLINARVSADLRQIAGRVEPAAEAADRQLEALEQQMDMLEGWRDRQLELLEQATSPVQPLPDMRLDPPVPGRYQTGGTRDLNAPPDKNSLEVAAMRREMQATQVQQITLLNRLDRQFSQWNSEGMPPTRDTNDKSTTLLLQVG